ncbi:MAG: C-terminal binding protein [Planctomyces sp.]|nr:C-terminal binding protein [Planctomyces sp.]
MSRPLVVVTDFIAEPMDHERRILGDLADLRAAGAMHEEELVGQVEEADALMLYHFLSLTRRTIERLKKCKLIVRCGVGFDNIDHRFARERGIDVANVPDYGTEEVADSAIGMMLTLVRGIHYMNDRGQQRQGEWIYTQVQPIHRLRTQTVGLIGLGRIGTATALRAKALGMNVLFYDPYVPDGRDKSLGITRVETLGELLSRADVVSLHCPRTPETTHIINRDAISQMKPQSYLVNTARGGCVDANAVLWGIESGHLRGAALDVLEVEPPLETEPLLTAWRDPAHPAHSRVIINPHSAFYSEEGLDDMRIKGSQNCRRVILGQAARNVVN